MSTWERASRRSSPSSDEPRKSASTSPTPSEAGALDIAAIFREAAANSFKSYLAAINERLTAARIEAEGTPKASLADLLSYANDLHGQLSEGGGGDAQELAAQIAKTTEKIRVMTEAAATNTASPQNKLKRLELRRQIAAIWEDGNIEEAEKKELVHQVLKEIEQVERSNR